MDELLRAVRDESSPATWSQGVKLSRSGVIVAKWKGTDEVEIRITKPSGIASPLITLSPQFGDWSCECPSAESPCPHVVAAVLMIQTAQAEGRDPLAMTRPDARLAYELERVSGGLALHMIVVRHDGTRTRWERSFAVLDRDHRVLDVVISSADRALGRIEGARRNGPILRPVIAATFKALEQCHDVTLDGKRVRFGEPRAIIELVVSDREGGGVRAVLATVGGLAEIFDNGAALDGDVLFSVIPTQLSREELAILRDGRDFPPDEMHAFMTTVLPELKKRVPVRLRAKKLPEIVTLEPQLRFQAEVDRGTVVVLPLIVYGDPPIARVDGTKLAFLGGNAVPARNERAEARLQQRLRTELQMTIGKPVRTTARDALDLGKKIQEFGGRVDGPGLDRAFVTRALTPRVSGSDDSFRVFFESEHEGEAIEVDIEAVMDAWQRHDDLVVLPSGGFAPLPADFLAKHGQLLLDLVAAKRDRATFPRAVGPDIAALCAALDFPVPPRFEALRRLAEDFEGLEEFPLPRDLTATLRPYQHDGVNWLGFIAKAEVGGLLADDMGLGKTLQAICVMKGRTLVVCPRSVLLNWRNEIQRFRPGLRIAIYHGTERSLAEDADVTLTTYALLRRDIETLSAPEWTTIVLDESQNIKNPKSQVAQAAFQLRGSVRLALTGTPVENRLEDLWSQMHFLNEGLLGGLAEFTERYSTPIAQGNLEVGKRLRARIRPFLLRRRKGEVAQELPPRTDVSLWCELTESEREIYDAILIATRRDVLSQLEAGGSVLAALEALLRLRQACCHRGLLPNQSAPSSSKIDLLLESLSQALDEGHRALVFSQWTSMLDLIEPHLQERSIDFTRLDGKTRDRQEVVDRFQAPNGPPVMLISLKAGGTGLTLTRADHVFLFDPWWNPAVEDQAADRTHRIGQDQPVLVHRLVALDTVEERLLALQERKRVLAQTAVGDALTGAAGGSLTREDLLELLS